MKYRVENGVLVFYRESLMALTLQYLDFDEITEKIRKIGKEVFENSHLIEVEIPKTVCEIGDRAFAESEQLSSVFIPDSVTHIGKDVFSDTELYFNESNWQDGALYIGNHLIRVRENYEGSFCVKEGTITVAGNAFKDCTKIESVMLPESVVEICDGAFENCTALREISIPSSVKKICDEAFRNCLLLADENGFVIFNNTLHSYNSEKAVAIIPDNVKRISARAFACCEKLESVIIPKSVSEIGIYAFENCKKLTSVTVSDSVEKIGYGAFNSPDSIVICPEGSKADEYCKKYHINYIFDYQFEAFGGVIPPGLEMLSSPFLADEEKPFVFISYSHKDRDEVLVIIKKLYESGWKIWYDEGLTIGDKYDETLENHVRECSAFLLFVTKNSIESSYIRENEIPWAKQYGKPIIKCLPDEGCDFDIENEFATVDENKIENALERVDGLSKGERRKAKGITVAFNPEERELSKGGNFAYTVYSKESEAKARSIILEARKNGCEIYDFRENTDDETKLSESASIIIFIDKAFLADEKLLETLIKAYRGKRDIAVCQLEEISEDDLPEELKALYEMQWLNFSFGITRDMNLRLARHLQKMGCRNAEILPDFEYEKNDEGIVITRYTGRAAEPLIESEYGGIYVVEIGENAFKNNLFINRISIPDGVKTVNNGAFKGCVNLTSVGIPESVKIIGYSAFSDCVNLSEVNIPEGIDIINVKTFENCKSIVSITVPESVRSISNYAFEGCTGLVSVKLPKNLKLLVYSAFKNCSSLTSVILPDGLSTVDRNLFEGCTKLKSVNIPKKAHIIMNGAFKDCISLKTLYIPENVYSIVGDVFENCSDITVICNKGSEAYKYCIDNGIKVEAKKAGLITLIKRRVRSYKIKKHFKIC